MIQKFIKDQTPVLLLVLPYDLLSEEDKKLLEIYSIQPPLEILHNQNTFIPPNLQQPKFNNNNIEVEVKVKGVGSPQTWNQTWVYLVSGKTPSLEVNKIDLDKEIWSETKFDFKGIFNGEELIFNFDTGSSGMIISENTLTKLGLEPEIDLNSPLICFANSSKTTSTKVISMPVEIGGYKENLKFQVLPNLNKEVIIGIPYTFNKNIFIDWKNRVLKFSLKDSLKVFTLTAVKENKITKSVDLDLIELLNDNKIYDKILNLNFEVNNVVSKNALDLDYLKTLPPKIQQLVFKYKKVFSENPHFNDIPQRNIDQKILIDPTKPFPKHQNLRPISDENLQLLDEFLEEKLKLGLIEPCEDSFGMNCLFVKEKTKTRIVIDFRPINTVTIPNKTPLVSFSNLKDRMKEKKFFTVVDIKQAFYNIRMEENSRKYTCFKTPKGLFRFKVCPMGLANSPAVWVQLMNQLFNGRDRYLSYYMDDVIIYSETEEEHLLHVEEVLKICDRENLRFALEKINFCKKSVRFCGFRVSEEGLQIDDPQKTAILTHNHIFKNIRDVRSFLGSVNFFRDFIDHIGELSEPLYKITRKDQKFEWDIQCHNHFLIIQFNLFNSPKLTYFNPKFKTILHSDASAIGLGGSLGQLDNEGKFRIVSFYSKQFSATERNYSVSDREFLGIMNLIKKYEVYLVNTEFLVITDHKALENLPNQADLNQRQIRWMEYLSGFNFKIQYLEGKFNYFADFLSRRSRFEKLKCSSCNKKLDLEENELCLNCVEVGLISLPLPLSNFLSPLEINNQIKFHFNYEVLDPLVKLKNPGKNKINPGKVPNSIVEINNLMISHNPLDLKFKERIQLLQSEDSFIKLLERNLKNNLGLDEKKLKFFNQFRKINEVWININNNQNRIYIPENNKLKLDILNQAHNSLYSGHFGSDKTFKLIYKLFFWNKMKLDVKRFVSSCDCCNRVKSVNFNLNPLMKSLPIPDLRFEYIGIDFKTMTMDKESGFDMIMAIHCLLSKYSKFIPVKKTITAKEVAKSLIDNWFLEGLGIPKCIVSDRDSKFTGQVWKEFREILEIKELMSTARHQRTNGGTEVLFKSLKNYFIKTIDYKDDEWVKNIKKFEFAYNNSINFSTNFTPFYLAFNLNPSTIPLINFNLITKSALKNSFLQQLKDLELAHQTIERTNKLNAKQFNKKSSLREINVGQFVFLKSDGIKLTSNKLKSRKFLSPWLGPFLVLEKDENNNFKLDLPPQMKIHPIFHQNILKIRPNPLEFFSL